ncbi:PH domain-containing protein [Rothia kristinae]|uniref:PH domain-containing protein n=1 Tax=Rothia kristinae TaxID=37923 RepID=A0A7T4T5F9_9MICC|nr:PH domain-containing protein [Rothia kristinae]QQC60275.1 PH domain-containing protein [Rothia kristinae]
MSRAPHPSSPDAAPAPQPSEDPMNREALGQPEAGPQWRRVHPLTPLARFWITAVLILVLFLRPLIEDVITGETDAGDLVRGAEEMAGGVSLLAVLTVLAAVAVVIGAMALTWWFTRWAVTEDSVHVREGILLRKERQARLERVQAIEITQPLLARLLRLAELRFDVADAEDAALHLRFLSLRQAEDLRGRLLSRARALRAPATSSGAASGNTASGNTAQGCAARDPRQAQTGDGPIRPVPGTTAGVPDTGIPQGGLPETEAPEGLAEREVLRVPLARAAAAPLLSAGLLSSLLAILLIAVALGWASDSAGPAVAGVLPMLLVAGSTVWSAVNAGAGFRVLEADGGLRTRAGLTDTRAQSIPLGRIHAIGIEQPLLWRLPGWYRVRLTSAGIGAGEGSETRSVLLPVGTEAQLRRLLSYVLGAVVRDEAPGSEDLAAALRGSGTGHGFTVSPPAARWLAPLTYRRSGFLRDSGALLLRGGRLTRHLSVVPQRRVQGVGVADGPLLRRLGLADVQLCTVAGPVDTRVRRLARADALALARLLSIPASEDPSTRGPVRASVGQQPSPTSATAEPENEEPTA